MPSTMDADGGCTGIHLARDQHSALDMPSSANSHVSAKSDPPSTSTIKQKGTSDNNHCPTPAPAPPPPRISIAPNSHAQWNTQVHKLNKRTLLHLQQELQPDQSLILHQSTCLNLNGTTQTDESELWILPNFDELESDSPAVTVPRQMSGEWAPLVSRAVNSNRERLRRRLEGDGWDFVCGRYGEDGKMLKELADAGEESVDEEFDVVVLPTMLQVSC